MTSLGVTISGQAFNHMVYHFVLTYSNWETASICFSESFESLSDGLQQALWELGGVPQRHRTDRMSLAVNNASSTKEFTARYQALMDHYGLEMEKINARQAHENGDVEQSHNRFKEAVDQALLLRGSRDFVNRAAYARFLRNIVDQRNAGRQRGSPRNGPCSAGSLRHGWRVTSERQFGSVPAAPFMWTETRIRSTAG